MAYALLLSSQKYLDGLQILQIVDTTFPVAEPLFWKECPNELYNGLYYYKQDTDQFIEIPTSTATPTSGEPPNVIG